MDLALCINSRKISWLLWLASSNTSRIYPYIIVYPCESQLRLNSVFKYPFIPDDHLFPLIVQVPLHFLREIIGRNNTIIRGSCSSKVKNDFPTGTVNNRSASFLIYLIHKKFIRQGTAISWDRYECWRQDSNSNSITFSSADGAGVHNKWSPCTSNQ